jgi:hypothetical protein
MAGEVAENDASSSTPPAMKDLPDALLGDAKYLS